MATPRQFDLFSYRGTAEVPAAPTLEEPVPAPADLDDAALIASIRSAGQSGIGALAREAVRRGLRDAVPVFEALCRRFAGFGLDHDVAEQTASLEALTAFGAKDAVARLIGAHAIHGPGRRHAFYAAATLGSVLPPDIVADGLRDNDPLVRAAACGCARSHAMVAALLIDLLTDLHPPVAQAAARALGRLGRREGVAILLRQLADAPSLDVVEALLPVAGDDEWVRLGQAAARKPSLAPIVLEMLDDADSPRAARIAAGLRRRIGLSG